MSASGRSPSRRGRSRVRPGRPDWSKPETCRPALEGAASAYVAYQPDLAVEGAPEAIDHFARLARESELKRVVLLSERGEPGAERAERALQASGIAWTIVPASWFNQNFSEGYLLDGILAGEVALPAGAVPEPFVDADDIADVAVAALMENTLNPLRYTQSRGLPYLSMPMAPLGSARPWHASSTGRVVLRSCWRAIGRPA